MATVDHRAGTGCSRPSRYVYAVLLLVSSVMLATRRFEAPPSTAPTVATPRPVQNSLPTTAPPMPTVRTRAPRTPVPHPPMKGCPIPPLFVMTDQTVCPFVLNLCESLVALGLPVAPLLHAKPQDTCAALVRATNHLFVTDMQSNGQTAEGVADSELVRQHAISIGRGGCLYLTYTPKLESRDEYPRLLMSKAASWIRWYDAVKHSLKPLPPYIGIVDADVELFPGAIELLSPYVNDPVGKHPDMIFQRDLDEKNPKNKNGNAGFFLLRLDSAPVEAALRWMAATSKGVLANLTNAEIKAKYPGGDQHLVYDIVREARSYGFSWQTFPRKLVNDGRAVAYWSTTAVHHPHMSGKYKPTNMRRLIAHKRKAHGNASVTTGECLPPESGMDPTCVAAVEQYARVPI